MLRFSLLLIFLAIWPAELSQAQYAPGVASEGTDAVHADSSSIISWASTVRVVPGYLNISDKGEGKVAISDSSFALGKSDNRTISLGDSGIVVVGFDMPIVNNSGHDFAVYENSFDGHFLELAKVEVSSDSSRWIEFPSISLTDSQSQIATFGELAPESIYNLAGKYKAYYGTPFDLQDIIDSAGIDLNQVKYVRITDVVGSVDALYATRDSEGNIINDPWPTPFATGGFDLDAVAILGNGTPVINMDYTDMKLWPNPASDYICLEGLETNASYVDFVSLSGQACRKHLNTGNARSEINISELKPGIYYIRIDGLNLRGLRLIKK